MRTINAHHNARKRPVAAASLSTTAIASSLAARPANRFARAAGDAACGFAQFTIQPASATPPADVGRRQRPHENMEVSIMGTRTPKPNGGAARRTARTIEETAQPTRRQKMLRPTHRQSLAVPLVLMASEDVCYVVQIAESIEPGFLVQCDHDAQKVMIRATDDARELVRLIANAAEQVATKGRDYAAEQRRFALAVELEQLEPFVDANTRQISPVRNAFRNANVIGPIDDFQPPLERLQAARDAFDAMPIEDRTTILNGWSPAPSSPPLDDVIRPSDDVEIRPVLTVRMSERNCFAEREFVTQCGGMGTPVSIVIQQGTTRADALRLLGDAMRVIREAWGVMVDERLFHPMVRNAVPSLVRDGMSVEQAVERASVRRHEKPGAPMSVVNSDDTSTEIITDASIDRHGRTIRVGDVVVECDGGVIATRGEGGAGRVLAVAGSAVIYALGDGRGFTTATASDCYVVAANEKSGASQTPTTPELAGNRSDEAKRATTAAA